MFFSARHLRCSLTTALLVLAPNITGLAWAQNVITEPYVMAADICDPATTCPGPNKTLYVLQSSDGTNWQTIPGFQPVTGSVPSFVRRGHTFYLLWAGAGTLIRYHMDTNVWDPPVPVQVSDTIQPVDTSLLLDANGNLALLYDTSSSMTGCVASTCADPLRIAFEVPGSDGASYVAQASNAATIEVGSGGGIGDPFVFFDGTQYVLYVTVGGGPLPQVLQPFPLINVFTSSTLGGPYALRTSAPNGAITNFGGQASGLFNPARQQYWDYWAEGSPVAQAMVSSLDQPFTVPGGPQAPPPPPVFVAAQSVITTATLGVSSTFQFNHPHVGKNWGGPTAPTAGAVLPLSRSVQVGVPATAFAALINTDIVTAADCFVAPLTQIPANFSFQTTDPKTNAVTGTANAPVMVPGNNGLQTFVIAFTPTAAFSPTQVQLAIGCASTTTATQIAGVTTLLLSASTTPVPDIVALAATTLNDGIVHIPGAGNAGDFAVATINLGANATITATAQTGAKALPVTLSICETVPSTGNCMGTPGPSATATIAPNATPTFAIFATASAAIPFDPANNRIFVTFTDGSGAVRGETSVAVETQ